MKLALVIAFVILTNPLFAQKKWMLAPDPGSLIEINFSPGNCKHFDENGVGCTQAILTFSRTVVRKGYYTSGVEVVFKSEGKWEGTVLFYPSKCEPLKNDFGAIRFLCKQVSWRTAK